MKLNDLLALVEARKDGHLPAQVGLGEAIDHYAKDLMPDLARRLKMAVGELDRFGAAMYYMAIQLDPTHGVRARVLEELKKLRAVKKGIEEPPK